MIDLFAHLGYICYAASSWFIGRRCAIGWLFRAAGSGTWLGVGIAMGSSPIWMWSAAFLVLDVIGFYRWRQPGRIKQGPPPTCRECGAVCPPWVDDHKESCSRYEYEKNN